MVVMSVTSRYSSEISQTALALLALVAAGKPLNPTTIKALQSILETQNDHEDRIHLTVFSDTEIDETETPVILPFSEREFENRSDYNAYGALQIRSRNSFENRTQNVSYLRIFSPDESAQWDDEDSPYCAVSGSSLRLYAE